MVSYFQNDRLKNLYTKLLLLTTASFGQILNDVDSYGTGSFCYLLDLRGNPGEILISAINAYNNLLGRNWIVRPPVIYDFGDAPNSYRTDIAS